MMSWGIKFFFKINYVVLSQNTEGIPEKETRFEQRRAF